MEIDSNLLDDGVGFLRVDNSVDRGFGEQGGTEVLVEEVRLPPGASTVSRGPGVEVNAGLLSLILGNLREKK